jgi:short-subunit dehydrogenase
MWHAELAKTPVRVSGLRPGPMRTALRARAFVEEDDRIARDPVAYAGACVELLSPAGAPHRGRIHAPGPALL